jgi:hypothetical protein
VLGHGPGNPPRTCRRKHRSSRIHPGSTCRSRTELPPDYRPCPKSLEWPSAAASQVDTFLRSSSRGRIIDHSDDHLANLDGADYDEVMLRGIGGPECQPRRGTDQGKVA